MRACGVVLVLGRHWLTLPLSTRGDSQYSSNEPAGMRTDRPTLIAGSSPDLILFQMVTSDVQPISTRSLIV